MQPGGVAKRIRSPIGWIDNFIHHIPGNDLTPKVSDHGFYIVQQQLASVGWVRLRLKPRWQIKVPNQGVGPEQKTAAGGKIQQPIRSREIVGGGCRVQNVPLRLPVGGKDSAFRRKRSSISHVVGQRAFDCRGPVNQPLRGSSSAKRVPVRIYRLSRKVPSRNQRARTGTDE